LPFAFGRRFRGYGRVISPRKHDFRRIAHVWALVRFIGTLNVFAVSVINSLRLPASLEIFAENAGVADRDSVGRRYLTVLSRKEAEIFILKVFAGKTRLVFFARQPEVGTQRINHDEDDRRASIPEKKLPASDLSDVQ